MKKNACYKLLLALAALLLLSLPAAAFADAALSIKADKESIQHGDTVEVTITVSGSAMAIAEGSFTYDPAILKYEESEGGASDGFLNLVSAEQGGAGTLVARIRFSAVGAGDVELNAAIDKIITYDGKEQAGGAASVKITVAAPAPTPTPTPIDYAKEGVEAQNVQGASEGMYIWRTLENVTIPSRYTESTLDYHGETVAAATVEDSDAPVLLYLSNATGDVGGYYIYDSDTLYPYRTLNSISKAYILLEPDGSVALPEGFTETTLTVGEAEYKAWKATDAQGDIYLLYARNPDGEVGYYVYNPLDESFQRYAVMPARPMEPTLPPENVQATPAPEQSAAPGDDADETATPGNTLFYIICGVAALLLIAVVGLLILRSVEDKRRRRRAAARRAERERALKQDAENSKTVDS